MKLAYKKTYNYVYKTSLPGQRVKPRTLHSKKKRVIQKTPLMQRIISSMVFLCLILFVLPYAYQHSVSPILKSIFPSKVGSMTNFNYLANKSKYIVHNDNLFGQRILVKPQTKKAEMQPLYEIGEMTQLKSQLNQLAAAYPTIQPAIYVLDYKTSKYIDINADKLYSAASIIKIPVLLELFKSIELKQLTLKDKFVLTDVFRAGGSGELQFKAENSVYTIDQLARMMMRDSDNSATNMLMASMGGVADTNRALRRWGMKNTHIENWLPDLEGQNTTTARELATMLLNVENPNFLSLSSREYVIDYMSDIRNNRLIHAGLPENALFIHKTGDIGRMLGDAGIVYTPEGEKYIVVILANRPHNAPQGKEFIVQASKLIYAAITTGKK